MTEGPTVSEPVRPDSGTSDPLGPTPLEQVLAVLDVKPDPEAGEDCFAGVSYRPPRERIFGGQVLGQSLMAAAKTVTQTRPVHSLHAYFLRPGDPDVPITFSVERLRDGRSFSARRTHALQLGQPLLSMISSYQEPGEGLDHQVEMPNVPGPDELPTLEEEFKHARSPMVEELLSSRPIDVRHVNGALDLVAGPGLAAEQAVWIRATAKMPDDQLLHTALMAYASDYSLLESVLRRHGLSWTIPGRKTASLDHAMWFHRPARIDEWLLYTQESPSASGARGLALGRLFTADGVLVASVAQEGMMRIPSEYLPS
jgi:acyl-CoA thioesterase-2